MEIIKVKTSSLQPNEGQIEGIPANPRIIKDKRYADLKKSIEEDPEFMEANPLKVFGNVVLCGNMRLMVIRELKWKEVPVIRFRKDTPIEVLRSRAIKDNHHYGEDDWDALANEWSDDPLNDWAVYKDYAAYNPNLTPESSDKEVTNADITNAEDKQENAFGGVSTTIEVTCPECAHTFRINKV